jgi:hypothetical protein
MYEDLSLRVDQCMHAMQPVSRAPGCCFTALNAAAGAAAAGRPLTRLQG